MRKSSRTGRTFLNSYIRLLLFGLLLTGLAACGDASTPTTSNTGISSTGTTSTSVTTPVVSTISTPLLTKATVTTLPDPTASNPGNNLSELLKLIPDKPEVLSELHYNNYAALRTVYGVTAKNVKELQADENAFHQWQQSFLHLTVVGLVPASFILQDDFAATSGYDALQVEQGLTVGLTPALTSVVRGSFDPVAIGDSWTRATATKGQIGTYPTYTFDNKLSFENQAQQKLRLLDPSAFNNIALLTDKKLLLSASTLTELPELVGRATTPRAGSLADNAEVKTLLSAFGSASSIYITNRLSTWNDAATLNPRATPDQILTANATKIAVPTARLGGLAWVEDKAGEGYYLAANYYTSNADAQKALPIYAEVLRNGKSLTSPQFYNRYFQVQSAEVQGNLIVFKLGPKPGAVMPNLLNFVTRRDFPLF